MLIVYVELGVHQSAGQCWWEASYWENDWGEGFKWQLRNVCSGLSLPWFPTTVMWGMHGLRRQDLQCYPLLWDKFSHWDLYLSRDCWTLNNHSFVLHHPDTWRFRITWLVLSILQYITVHSGQLCRSVNTFWNWHHNPLVNAAQLFIYYITLRSLIFEERIYSQFFLMHL